MSAPTVSVVMATYNRADLIAASVRSLAAQTYPPTEIIVVDDASTDHTLRVLGELEREITQLRVVASPRNQGASRALNTAIELATGDYIAIADDDDACMPRRLEWSVDLAERRGAAVVGGQVVGVLRWPLRFATSRFPTDREGTRRRIEAGLDPLPHITMMFRRELFEQFGPYLDVRRVGDLELMLRWARHGVPIAVSPEVFATYTFRWEFFSVDTQTRWMLLARYARALSLLDDPATAPSFDNWILHERVAPARREARWRVARLIVRVAVGTVFRRS